MDYVDWSESMVQAKNNLRHAEDALAKADYESAWDHLTLVMAGLRQVASVLALKRLQ